MKVKELKIVVILFMATISGCGSIASQDQNYSICEADSSSRPHLLFGQDLMPEVECLKNGVILTCEYFNEGYKITNDDRGACKTYAKATQLYLARRYSTFVKVPAGREIEYIESSPCESAYINGQEYGSCSPRIEAVIPFERVASEAHNKSNQQGPTAGTR